MREDMIEHVTYNVPSLLVVYNLIPELLQLDLKIEC